MSRVGKRARVAEVSADSFKVERPAQGRFVIVTVNPGSTSEIRYSVPKKPLGLPSDRVSEHARA
jgi:hypothetical protein